jgi:hypothetical protein
MAGPATRGVSTVFTLNAMTAMQISIGNSDSGRTYFFCQNLDSRYGVELALGTGNQAMATVHHRIPQNGYFEYGPFNREAWMNPTPCRFWGLNGDISAIAEGGTPILNYLEW